MPGWISLKMRFPGKCLECGKPIPAGQQAMWSRGVGVKHEECGEAGTAGGGQEGGGLRSIDDSNSSTRGGTGSAARLKPVRITCSICGRPAGCAECEFLDSCDTQSVSPACLCRDCGQKDDVMGLYEQSVGGRFSVLSPVRGGP